MQLYHSILVNALLGWEFGNGEANGNKEHDPRVGERRFVGRDGSRVDAIHARRSITSTSTVPYGGLSTSTMGSCGGVGQNGGDHPLCGQQSYYQETADPRLGCIALFVRDL